MSEVFRIIRKGFGMTQGEYCNLFCVSGPAVSYWERKARKIPAYAQAIAGELYAILEELEPDQVVELREELRGLFRSKASYVEVLQCVFSARPRRRTS